MRGKGSNIFAFWIQLEFQFCGIWKILLLLWSYVFFFWNWDLFYYTNPIRDPLICKALSVTRENERQVRKRRENVENCLREGNSMFE